MSDMLSQEEIDALLRGDSGSSQENSSSQELTLTNEEIDALGEIGNISMGTSATTLNTLLNQRVNITTPKVSVLSIDELSNLYPAPYVAVSVQYTEGLEGTNLLILKEDDVKIITNLMMGGPGVAEEGEINDLHLSAISEAMNQMIGSSSTSLATMLNKKIDISPPQAFSIDFNDPNRLREFNIDDKIVRISFRMEIGDIIDSEIMQLLPISFAKSMVAKLYNNVSSTEVKQATVQSSPTNEAPRHQPQNNNVSNNNTMSYQEPARVQSQPPRVEPKVEHKVVNVQPVQYQYFENDNSNSEKENIDFIKDIPLEVTVELGRTKKLIKDILEFGPGTIIELDKLAGEPVDILVNGKYIAKGEVVVIDESFGVRITDIISASKRLNKIQ